MTTYWGLATRENGSSECISSPVKVHVSAWVDRLVSMPGIESVEMFAESGDSSERAMDALRKRIGAQRIQSWRPGQFIQLLGGVDMRKPRVIMKDRGTHYLGAIEMPRVDGGCIRTSAVGAFPWDAVKKAATAAMRIASDPALVPIIGPSGLALATSARAVSKMAEQNMPLLRRVARSLTPVNRSLARSFTKRANTEPKQGGGLINAVVQPRQATNAYQQGTAQPGVYQQAQPQQQPPGYYPPGYYPPGYEPAPYGGQPPPYDPYTSPEQPGDEYFGGYDDGHAEQAYQEEWDNGENGFADQAEEAGDDTTDPDWQEQYGGEA